MCVNASGAVEKHACIFGGRGTSHPPILAVAGGWTTPPPNGTSSMSISETAITLLVILFIGAIMAILPLVVLAGWWR